MSSIAETLGRPPVHPFPARMSAGLALAALSSFHRPVTVLDPMVGSGTGLAIARAHGHRCIGFDVDPLAVLIARVWTRTLDEADFREASAKVLREATRLASGMASRDAYPATADTETKEFTRFWFDDYVRRQLTALSIAIARIESNAVREALWCAFSRLIITKQAGASLALDLAHSRPHRAYSRAPRKPFARFTAAVDRVMAGCVTRDVRNRGPASRIDLGDARSMPLQDQSVDLVITSPPYLNAIDYLRCSKFSLIWMGYSIKELRSIRSKSIGAEIGSESAGYRAELNRLHLRPSPTPRMRSVLARYMADTDLTLKETARVLATGGQAVFVVGENTIRGTYVPTAKLMTQLALSAGLRLTSRRSRSLPGNRRYLPPPNAVGNSALDTRMRREVILTFERPARLKSSS